MWALLLVACGGSGSPDVPGAAGVPTSSADAATPDVPAPPTVAPSGPAAGPVEDDLVEEDVRWVAAHQSRDGRWEVGGWNRWSMGERVSGDGLTGLGSAHLDVAATALALLAYAGAGYTVDSKSHIGPVIAWGLHALLYRQDADGAFGDPLDPSWPVNHALALLALTEIAELRPQPRLVEAVQRGVECFRRSRAAEEDRWTDEHAFGGLPPFAWIALASERARLATAAGQADGRPSATGIDGDPALARDRALVASWISLPDSERTLAKLGAGLQLGLREAEGGKRNPAVVAAATWIGEHAPRWDATGVGVDAVGWWIATVGVFGPGGEPWKKWEAALKPAVVDTQRKDGTYGDLKGSWDPVGAGAAEGGRVVMTLACSLMLQIWYRYDKVFGEPGDGPAKTPARAAPARPAPARASATGEPALPRRRYPPRK